MCFILHTVMFIDAALNISLNSFENLMFYDFIYPIPNILLPVLVYVLLRLEVICNIIFGRLK